MPKPMKRLATPEMTNSLVNSLVNLVDVTWQNKELDHQKISDY